MTEPNPSTAQARAMADELSRHGVGFAVISPGSRSTALALALDAHPGITTRIAVDERSAAFAALGWAKASGSPAVALATSGTAVVNFHPAVVEAHHSLTPLIVLSADRPPELLHVSANQTIDQIGLFGGSVRWSCTMGVAEADRDLDGYWRSTVSQAVARAAGYGGAPGPVHLNVPFREPTVAVADDGRSVSAEYRFEVKGREDGAPWQRHHPPGPSTDLPRLTESKRGLLVVGSGGHDSPSLAAAAAEAGWPVLATATSGIRGGEVVTAYHHLLIEGVPAALVPDTVVTVGDIGPSDRLAHLTALACPQIHVERWGWWRDPRRHSTSMLVGDASMLVEGTRAEPSWRDAWLEHDRSMRAALDEALTADDAPTGPALARRLAGSETLVVGSSLPIRDVDAHTLRSGPVIANRGASGIDGVVSTALGVAETGARTTALVGDLSFLHDLTALLVDQVPPLSLVVVDNNGGGLFDLLPQSRLAPGYERLFVAPHGLDLVEVASSLGMEAARLESLDALDTSRPGMLVVPVDRETDLKMRQRLETAARSVLNRPRGRAASGGA